MTAAHGQDSAADNGVFGNVWVVEGDDHEVEVVEADSAEDALDMAHSAFRERYGRYSRDLLTVAGSFRGDIDDLDSLQFVAIPDAADEQYARRVLQHW